MFRKDFYIEVPELAKMTDAEVDDYRTEMEGIKVCWSFIEYVFSLICLFLSAKARMFQNQSRTGLSAV